MAGIKKYNLILKNEENFARHVAFGLWIKRPISPWHYLLPGMFIFDYLRRSAMVQNYSAAFLFPRKLALDLSLQALEGQERRQLMLTAEERIKEWLDAHKLYSAEIKEKHMEQISILIEHYVKLLKIDGNEYAFLIKKAYGDKTNYENFVEKLTAAENYIDLAIAHHLGNTEEIKKRLEAERKQVAELRKKEMQNIFPA
ncbi:MAG: NF038143 family protein [Thermodesulfobacteriota bacterium]